MERLTCSIFLTPGGTKTKETGGKKVVGWVEDTLEGASFHRRCNYYRHHVRGHIARKDRARKGLSPQRVSITPPENKKQKQQHTILSRHNHGEKKVWGTECIAQPDEKNHGINCVNWPTDVIVRGKNCNKRAKPGNKRIQTGLGCSLVTLTNEGKL